MLAAKHLMVLPFLIDGLRDYPTSRELLSRREKPSHPQNPTKKRAKVKAARKQRRRK